MSIINFTVEFDFFATQSDADEDVNIVPLMGDVIFTPLTANGFPVLSPGYSPRPAGFKLLPSYGYMDSDGQLKDARGGAVGVRLAANDPVLNLDVLSYRVDFYLRTPGGQSVPVTSGYFDALDTDGTLNLANVLQSTSGVESGGGVVADNIYASEIVDATTIGRALIKAANTADARTAIRAVGKDELVINFADYGVCDGVTNDAAALTTALAALSAAGGGTLQLPPKSIALTLSTAPMFDIPGNVKILGSAGATKLLLSTNGGATDYRCFASTSGNNVIFDGVTFIRQSDYTLVFFFPGPYDGFHMRNCVIDGRQNSYPTNYVHGIDLDATGTKSNLSFKGCTIKRVWYGLFQSNAITSTVDSVVFDDCTFTGNFGDDLAFNAPNSIMKNISVTSCRFSDSVSTVATRGFAVDFAHVIGGSVIDCHFSGYSYEPVHVEDYSTDIKITGNRFVNSGTVAGGVILVMTGSSEVVISGNTIDARNNTNDKYGILVLAAGTGTTPGGRAEIAPLRTVVSDNVILCGQYFGGIYIENVPAVTVMGNQVIGAGTVTAGVWNDGNTRSGIVCDGSRTVITGNTISGFRYAMSGPFGARNTLGDPGTVSNNVISSCYAGIWAASPGSLSITGNTMSNCVRPMIVGEATVTAKPCSISGNFASGCVYPLEIGGKLIILREAPGYSVTVGTGRSIYVIDKLLKIPVGTVFTFSGGGKFTVTTAAGAAGKGQFSYELVGDVTEATIGATDVGTASALAFSTTSGNNYVTTLNNTDTVAAAYNLITATDLSSSTNTFPTFDSDLLSAGVQTIPRWNLGTTVNTASGFLYLTYATAPKSLSVTAMRMVCGATVAGATPSLIRIGIYAENPANGNLTLVGSTASDTTLFGSANGVVSKALSATTNLVGGTRYAFGLIVVTSATAPSVYGVAVPSAVAAYTPRRTGVLAASDLPSTISSGSMSATGSIMYVAAV